MRVRTQPNLQKLQSSKKPETAALVGRSTSARMGVLLSSALAWLFAWTTEPRSTGIHPEWLRRQARGAVYRTHTSSRCRERFALRVQVPLPFGLLDCVPWAWAVERLNCGRIEFEFGGVEKVVKLR